MATNKRWTAHLSGSGATQQRTILQKNQTNTCRVHIILEAKRREAETYEYTGVSKQVRPMRPHWSLTYLKQNGSIKPNRAQRQAASDNSWEDLDLNLKRKFIILSHWNIDLVSG